MSKPEPTGQAEPATAAPRTTPDAADLARRVAARERRAIAQAITELERFAPGAPDLVAALIPYLGHGIVIGITGPPGAGKSTLVNALIRQVRGQGRTVGVIAVDPSSPVSGGAILGDRIRMTAALDDDGVFVRSLASRGHLGGLSPAAVRIIDALDAARFDLILIETVGTGQNEIDVAEIADVRIVVAAPGLGDDVQAMKSGLLEIADILVVNKGDRPDAERTVHQLMGALSIRARAAGSGHVPVLKTTATEGEGIADLVAAIETKAAIILAEPPAQRRQRRASYLIARAAADVVTQRLKAGSALLGRLAGEVLAGRLTPEEAARRLITDTGHDG
ncbi:MAG: methylmalonyl Co-A mutase-associated GTPase MeaB [Hyphomicrobiaceae bacterium]|nr:methylmalonyl Co-A mutase-associated GTPase MeaB [Hyphomicrobiaceae bacterium]